MLTAKLTKRPPDLLPRPQRNNVAATRPVIDKSLTITKWMIPSFESICEDTFANGGAVQMMDFAFPDLGSGSEQIFPAES